ncbi:MAG: hypothetical protein NVS3B18_04740 [Candidatus Dormibacteria bacterium]
MARFYAQLFVLPFAILGIGGLFLGDASHVVNGQAQGNLGGLTLHLTYVRDALDVLLALVFGYVGFGASRHLGKLAVIAAGGMLSVLAVVGFLVGDDATASRGIAGLHCPLTVNLVDLVTGVLGILAGLGTIEDEPRPFLR